VQASKCRPIFTQKKLILRLLPVYQPVKDEFMNDGNRAAESGMNIVNVPAYLILVFLYQCLYLDEQPFTFFK